MGCVGVVGMDESQASTPRLSIDTHTERGARTWISAFFFILSMSSSSFTHAGFFWMNSSCSSCFPVVAVCGVRMVRRDRAQDKRVSRTHSPNTREGVRTGADVELGHVEAALLGEVVAVQVRGPHAQPLPEWVSG